MKILFVHNRYQQLGGEETVVAAEIDMLQDRGHEVVLFEKLNDDIPHMSKMKLAAETIWSRDSAREFERLARSFEPDIVHAHNTFPRISPSIYWKAESLGIPVVQTLHNFRLICPQAMLLRDSKVCEKCVNKIPWRSIPYRCYRDSATQSAVLTSMLVVHRMLGTYRSRVSAYIALTDFSKRKLVEGGLPADRIHVKPNFVDIADPTGNVHERRNGLFVGRLYHEKGIDTLAEAVSGMSGVNVDVVGSGRMEGVLAKHACFTMHGWKTAQEVQTAMRRASYLIVPSIWHETFGLIIIEAFANRLPVIASRIGALQELVTDGVTGLLTEPGSAEDLRSRIEWAQSHPQELLEMGRQARRVYEEKFTSDSNYEMLMRIYESAL